MGNPNGHSGISACVLASGSKGNSTYITDGENSILVDAGLSGIETLKRLDSRNLPSENIKAILVTHEHTDHIKGAGILSRRLGIPVYINRKTYAAAESKIGKVASLCHFECGDKFIVNGFLIHPFSISHDAADPSGFTIEKNGSKVGIATDLGVANLVVRDHLKGCGLLIIESNHDPVMLMGNENYPWSLKQRVRSRKGHLANAETGELVRELVHEDLTHVILAHLSEENNCPHKALDVTTAFLAGHDVTIAVARQEEASTVIHLP